MIYRAANLVMDYQMLTTNLEVAHIVVIVVDHNIKFNVNIG